MPAINYVLLFCPTCGERRKIAPEKCYEQRKFGELEWAEFRAIECPVAACEGRMKRAAEYGEPTLLPQGILPMSTGVEWMS